MGQPREDRAAAAVIASAALTVRWRRGDCMGWWRGPCEGAAAARVCRRIEGEGKRLCISISFLLRSLVEAGALVMVRWTTAGGRSS